MIRQTAYVGAMVLLSGALTVLASRSVPGTWLGGLWIAGFFVVSLHLSYMAVLCALAPFVGRRRIAEAAPATVPAAAQAPRPATELAPRPATAVLYVVRHEGGDLEERMARSLAGNAGRAVDLWLISNSRRAQARRQEAAIVRRLQRRFDTEVGLFHPPANALGRKHVAIQRWLRAHPGYRYAVVCDADTVLPAGTVERLVAKAEHADSADVLIFQAQLDAADSTTRFARFLEPGQNVVQRLVSRVNFAVFGRVPYFGHGALIRCAPFAELDIPESILSHDLWETAALDRAGWRVAYCEDVTIRELLPADFLAYRARNRRWILGNLQALPLLAVPGLSAGARFHLGMALFAFLVQPVFLLWLLLGLALAPSAPPAALLAAAGGLPALHLELGGLCFGTLGFVWLHRLGAGRSPQQVLELAREVATGAAVLLNGLVYDSLSVLAAPWLPRAWPAAERGRRRLSLASCLRRMAPSMLLGAALLATGLLLSPAWTLLASPLLASFLLGGFTVYWTSRPCSKGCDGR